MKKILTWILSLVCVLTFASCGEEKQSESQGNTPSVSSGTSTTQSEAATGIEVTVTLQNNTEITFKSIAVSPAGKKQWAANLLSKNVEPNTSCSVKIKVPLKSEDLQYDLLATDTKGETTTFQYLDLSECTEKGGTISLNMTEGGDGMAMFAPPYTAPTLKMNTAPNKSTYKVGEKYNPAGFSATYTDENGVAAKIGADDVKFIVSGTVEIKAGRPFTQAGKKLVVFQYKGLKGDFELVVK